MGTKKTPRKYYSNFPSVARLILERRTIFALTELYVDTLHLSSAWERGN